MRYCQEYIAQCLMKSKSAVNIAFDDHISILYDIYEV